MIRRFSAFLATFLMASAAIAAALPQNNKLSLNVHNWVDYIAPMTNSDFTAATGIAVNYTTYEASEELDAQLAKGAQYDIAVSTASPFFSKQVQAGYFRPLDKSKIPNFAKLDKALLQLVAIKEVLYLCQGLRTHQNERSLNRLFRGLVNLFYLSKMHHSKAYHQDQKIYYDVLLRM